VDNIKMDLREIGWDGVDWIDMAQDRDQWKSKPSYKPIESDGKLSTWSYSRFLGLVLDPDERGDMLHQIIRLSLKYTALQPGR
jgi:hypothetical protein